MKLIAFLKKIGILRYGSVAATYKNAEAAPDMLITDVYPTQRGQKLASDTDKPASSD
ncbi:MAG: hypothetical protein V2I56_25180 [Desulfobacteraceae bacterium]|jgi:hypothetical protein|nr:hypothetical protein [Desulfobacteraceae bacterium]